VVSYFFVLFFSNDSNNLNSKGSWIPGKNAGGSFGDDFWKNPQFIISFTSGKTDISTLHSEKTKSYYDDFSNDNNGGEPKKSSDQKLLIVSLFSKDNNRESNRGNIVSFPKQFFIYRLLNDDSSATEKRIQNNKKFQRSELEKVGQSDMVGIFRECSQRFHLIPGTYVIIPFTYDANISGNFLLRFFTEGSTKLSDTSSFDQYNGDNNNNQDDPWKNDNQDNPWQNENKDDFDSNNNNQDHSWGNDNSNKKDETSDDW